MGLGNNNGRFTYANITKGKVAVKQDGVVNLFGYVEGWLRDIEVRDDEYKNIKYKKLCLVLSDGTETFQLQMKLNSGYGRAFCKIIKNADLTKPLRLQPAYSEDNDKKSTSMFIDQNGNNLKWYYKNSELRDLPPMEQITFKGETVWDDSKQQLFFINMLLNEIRPQLDAAALEVHTPIAAFPQDQAPTDSAPDDLPF